MSSLLQKNRCGKPKQITLPCMTKVIVLFKSLQYFCNYNKNNNDDYKIHSNNRRAKRNHPEFFV